MKKSFGSSDGFTSFEFLVCKCVSFSVEFLAFWSRKLTAVALRPSRNYNTSNFLGYTETKHIPIENMVKGKLTTPSFGLHTVNMPSTITSIFEQRV